MVRNYSVGGPATTKSRDMTLDWWLLTSSEMSVLHASHVQWPIPRWKWLSPTMKNLGLRPLGPSILDPYMWTVPLDRCSPVFSVRDKKFQKVTNWSALVPEISLEQRDLWPLGLLDVVWMQWNKWSGISLWVVQGPQKAEINIRLMTSHFYRNVSFAY